jgi:hypothetical protein
MRWIPRLLAGTAVVVAAALTAAPVTAGLADLVLNPGPQTTKRGGQPALTSQRTPTPSTARTEESAGDGTSEQSGAGNSDAEVIEGTIVDDSAADSAGADRDSTNRAGTELVAAGTAATGTELVAATADAAKSRVSDLAADLQAGVAAGEFTQADADRVLADISSYIHGDRTWPERLSA